MGKKKSWFTYVKRLFISEPEPKSEKKGKNSRFMFKSKRYPAIEAPKTTLINDAAEEERGRHAVAIATAAIAAAKAAAEVARLTNLSQELRRKSLHSAATKIQTCYKGYLARKALSALTGVVKLQAVVRGELVRRHWEFRLQRSMKKPATIGTTNLAQLKLRNAIKHAQNEDSISPFTHRRRSFCHLNDDEFLQKAQIFPAYMAATESAKAKAKTKARSSSTPKQRRRLPDSCSCQDKDSPTKLSSSSWSSFNSELMMHGKRSVG